MLAQLIPLVAVLAPVAVQAQQLSNGNWMQSGIISSTLRWQSSGNLTAGKCPRQVAMINCYSISLGGAGTNLQSTTQAQYLASQPQSSSSSLLRTFAATSEPSTQAQWADLAASDDSNLEAYYRAFPPTYNGGLIKRQVVRNCTNPNPPPPTDPTLPPPPPPPPSPRQRVELMAWPGAKAGETWKYTWKTNHAPTSIGKNFNHIWQILRRDACGGAVITLDLKNDMAVIQDSIRSCSNGICASVPISQWWSRTIIHTLTIRFGLRGQMSYTAVSRDGVQLLKYIAKGDMGADASLKTGTYRLSASGMTPSLSWVGDWTATRM